MRQVYIIFLLRLGGVFLYCVLCLVYSLYVLGSSHSRIQHQGCEWYEAVHKEHAGPLSYPQWIVLTVRDEAQGKYVCIIPAMSCVVVCV